LHIKEKNLHFMMAISEKFYNFAPEFGFPKWKTFLERRRQKLSKTENFG